jgi:hypothetical protein
MTPPAVPPIRIATKASTRAPTEGRAETVVDAGGVVGVCEAIRAIVRV